MAIHAALVLALAGSLVLAAVLWRWAERGPGLRQLTLFLLGVSVWIVGNELPTWFGPGTARLGLAMLATAALTSAVFLHFAAAFTRLAAPRLVLSGYALGGAAMLLSVVLLPGEYRPFAGLRFVAVPNAVGWCTSIVWVVLAGTGQLVLLRALLGWTGLARRQLAAVMASSAWGLLCMSGYGFAALDLPVSPWPLLGLPLYPVLLVYGILRYQVLVANAWARRALGWTLLVAAAGVLVALLPLLPFGTALGNRLALALEVGVAFLLLGGPARRLAERIVYPGGTVTPDDMTAWRATLGQATDAAGLAGRAAFLLNRRLSIDVLVRIGEPGPAGASPLLVCRRTADGWRSSLESGWSAAPPGPRRVAELLGLVLAEEAGRLERARALAEQERERQVQSRLAELGALAATVAHDVRNPLNIIGMAVATAAPEVREEVADQVRRIARLADDLLDYARPWSVVPATMDLAALARGVAARRGGHGRAPPARHPARAGRSRTGGAGAGQPDRQRLRGRRPRGAGGGARPGLGAAARLRRRSRRAGRPAGPGVRALRVPPPRRHRARPRHRGADRGGQPRQHRGHRAAGLVHLLHPEPAPGGGGGVVSGGILLVDDEPAFQRLGGAWLRRLGHAVTVAGTAEEALARYADARPDLVLLDLSMPPRMDPLAGIELIAGFLPTPVVVLTGHAAHDIALRATEAGAWDFIAKPVDPDMLRFVVERGLRKAALDRELRELRERTATEELGLLGRSEAVARLRAMIRRLGPSTVSVLVLGPTGTGKELVARALHACSPRAAGPFVPIHCGALPASLLESELFGHVKGSFTGAVRDQPGLIETAHRGTMLLDEVGEMPPAMQVKLLRFLQEGTFLPVGGRTTRRADVRVVAATHRDLELMVAEGGFREDLFYRLKGMVLRTPALAERPEDVALLAHVFLRRAEPGAVLAADGAEWLGRRSWPGNVRELRAMIEAAAALAGPGGEPVDAALLRFVAGELQEPPAPAPAGASTLGDALEAVERRMLSEALAAAGGNQSEAARTLGISRVGLIRKLARLGMRPDG